MKNWMATLILGVSLSAAAAGRTVELAVPDMNCASCPATVKLVLDRIDGVQVQSAELESKRVVAIVREDVPEETLLDAIRKAGYTPEILPAERVDDDQADGN